MVDDGTIDQLCRHLAESGDFATIQNMIRVNRDIHTICKHYLDEAKNLYTGIVLIFTEPENIISWRFLFEKKDVPKLKQEIIEYNEYVDSNADLPTDAYFSLYDLSDGDDVEELFEMIVEEQHRTAELVDIITKKYNEEEFYMGYHLLPMTEKLVKLTPIQTKQSEKIVVDKHRFSYSIHEEPNSFGSFVY